MNGIQISKVLFSVSVLAWLFFAPVPAGGAEEKRFDPEKCFPLECLGYLRVHSGRELAGTLKETLIGRIATDPEVRSALGNLPELIRGQLRQVSEPVIELTGRDPLELLGLLRSEVALSIVGLDPAAKVIVVAAVELGAEREAVLDVVKKITAGFAKEAGRDLSEVEIAGRKTVAWPLLGGLSAVYHLTLGSHIVFATSREALRGIAEAFDGAPGSEDFSLAANPRYKEANEALRLEGPRFTGFLNIEAIRGLAMTFLSRDPSSKDAVQALRASGLLSIAALGGSLGGRGGEIEGKLLLGTGEEARGLLGDLFQALSPPSDTAAALALVPAESFQVGAVGIDAGKMFRAVHGFVHQALPAEIVQEIDGSIRKMEERSGLSLEKDLFTLGKIDLWSFATAPPAGGLIPDTLALARTEAFVPYRRVLEKVLRALGKEPKVLEGPGGGPRMAYLRAGSVFTGLLGIETPELPDGLPLALLQPPLSLVCADLSGGWTVLGTYPVAVSRYLARGASASRMDRVEAVAGPIRTKLSGAAAFSVLRTGRSVLAVYNTLVDLAASFGSFLPLETFGLDLDRLPPGEKFLGDLKDRTIRVDVGPKGLVIHGRCAGTKAGTN